MFYDRWRESVREPLRRATFRFLARAFSTDDGRRILTEALAGQLATPGVRALESASNPSVPYSDLGGAPNRQGRISAPPVFITARFRSGSTLLWNIFRQVPSCRAYYEPLNERRWFDAEARGDRTDPTHLGVSDYWREYEGLGHLGRFFRERWIDHQLYMSKDAWDPNLKAYIRELIDAAPGQAVLQFNRVDFRLEWLRHHFPEARIIHLFRHPRDQWCSSLVEPDPCGPTCSVRQFAEHDHFYLLAWARDLRDQFPFLDPATADHPYDLFYLIWKLSYLFGRRFADESFCFEDLLGSPDVEVRRLVAAAGVATESIQPLTSVVSDRPIAGKWRRYADDDWFKRRESQCEAVLAEFVGARTPVVRHAGAAR